LALGLALDMPRRPVTPLFRRSPNFRRPGQSADAAPSGIRTASDVRWWALSRSTIGRMGRAGTFPRRRRISTVRTSRPGSESEPLLPARTSIRSVRDPDLPCRARPITPTSRAQGPATSGLLPRSESAGADDQDAASEATRRSRFRRAALRRLVDRDPRRFPAREPHLSPHPTLGGRLLRALTRSNGRFYGTSHRDGPRRAENRALERSAVSCEAECGRGPARTEHGFQSRTGTDRHWKVRGDTREAA
jgi:hypothetical protein